MLLSSVNLPEASSWLNEVFAELESGEHPQISDSVRLRVMLNTVLLTAPGVVANQQIIQRVVTLAEQLNDPYGIVIGSALLAHALAEHDNKAAAQEGQKALEAARSTGNDVLVGLVIPFAVGPILRTRDYESARTLLEQACAIDTARYGAFESPVLYQAGRLAADEGDIDRADHYFVRAEHAAARSGSAMALSFALYGRHRVLRAQGRDRDALDLMRRVFALDLIVQPSETPLNCALLAMLACDLGDESAIVHAALHLGTQDRELVRLADHILRGCLALVRQLRSAAHDHLTAALRICVDASYATMFADVADYWARTLEPSPRAEARQIIRDFNNDKLKLDAAWLHLISLTEEHQ
jgi:tetratricopeptide (TPR) repeat protein